MIQFLLINRSFELVRSDLHLRESQRVPDTMPGSPLHTFKCFRRVLSSEVKTVQVGVVTCVVPPGTMALHSTLMTNEVLVISAELLS